MKSCPNCNAENDINSKFCENCGAELVDSDTLVKTEEKPSIILIILGYITSILGIFSLGILSVVGLVLGVILFRRGGPDKIHGIIISLIAIIILLFTIVAVGALLVYRSYFYTP